VRGLRNGCLERMGWRVVKRSEGYGGKEGCLNGVEERVAE
jgi:hypothetical protein